MRILRKLFGKYLLATNTVSCGLMMATGDFIQQRADHWKRHRYHQYFSRSEAATWLMPVSSEEQAADIGAAAGGAHYQHNYIRTRNMTMVGLIQGPFHHCFYTMLERIAPGRGASSIVKKTFLDQTIASPICLAIFFIGLGLMERDKIEEVFDEIKLKLIDTWKVDCCFWPPTQCVNFLFVPLRYRVLYTNVMTMVYDIFLSYVKYDAHFD